MSAGSVMMLVIPVVAFHLRVSVVFEADSDNTSYIVRRPLWVDATHVL